MSLLDIHKDSLIYEIFRLENEKVDANKKDILKKIQKLIEDDRALDSLLKHFSFKNANEIQQAAVKNQIEAFISNCKLMNDTLQKQDLEPLLKLLKEDNSNHYGKIEQYAKYLIAAEQYQNKTGKISQDEVQSVNTKNNNNVTAENTPIVTPIQAHTSSNNGQSETEKPPIFIDKSNFNNGSVIKYRGIDPEVLKQIDKGIVDEINKQNPGSIKFTLINNGYKITADEEKVFAEFTKREKQALEDRYQIFSHTSDKVTKDIPEKYHFDSQALSGEQSKNANNQQQRMS